MKFSLGKQEKLKSKKLIQLLFQEGKQLKVFPLKLLYLPIEHNGSQLSQVAFSVPKKNHKKAVSRNRIKRLMREVFRVEKPGLYASLNDPHIFMFIFMGKEMAEFRVLEEKMSILLSKLKEKTTHEKNNMQ